MTCGECGNVTAPGAGFPNHVYCKRFLLHMEKREDASRCRDFIPKPITNADRIRSMSDEELAELIDGFLFEKQKLCAFEHEANTGEYLCPGYDLEKRTMRCKICWLDWLRQEAE